MVSLFLAAAMTVALAGCGANQAAPQAEKPVVNNEQTAEQPTVNQEVKLSGEIKIDGSSTVVPITEAVAEEFAAIHPGVKIPVGISGTGGGFKKFVIKETDISNASRPIKEKEAAEAQANGVEYLTVKIAFDGLSVVVNSANDFVDYLTVEELNKMWAPDSTVKTWKDVRADWPNEPIKFYAPGVDSGTFDYFTEEINGKGGAIRQDFTPSEDDNVLVQGIAGDKYAIGFFGYAYYEANADVLKVIKIDGGKGPVEPTYESIKDGSYAPLSRPLFIYVNKESLQRAEVKEFIKFYLTEGRNLAKEVGYTSLPDAEYEAQLNEIQ